MTASTSASRPTSALRHLAHRWPTAAGVTLALLTGLGIASGGEVAPIVTASGFVYLGAAALQRREAAWPAFAASFVLIVLGRVVAGFAPIWWTLGIAAVLAAYGLLHGAARPAWGLPLQIAAMLVLGAVALAAVAASPLWSGLLVAAALLAHAAWDVHHHRTGRVVVASMSEFCAVLDTLLAVVVLVVTLA